VRLLGPWNAAADFASNAWCPNIGSAECRAGSPATAPDRIAGRADFRNA